jgi:hypothetical protein
VKIRRTVGKIDVDISPFLLSMSEAAAALRRIMKDLKMVKRRARRFVRQRRRAKGAQDEQ